MNEKCCICPHFNETNNKCEADPETDICLVDAIEAFINKLMEEEQHERKTKTTQTPRLVDEAVWRMLRSSRSTCSSMGKMFVRMERL